MQACACGVPPVSRALVLVVFVGGLVLGAAADRALFAERRAKLAASTAAPEKPVAPTSTPELAACATARDALRAQLVRCAVGTPEPEGCPPCPPPPSMPGLTPEEEASAGKPEPPILKPLLAACEKGRNKLRRQLGRCVRGEPLEDPEPAPSGPVRTREEEQAILWRSYETPIKVRRADGTVRIYNPHEWPPAGGVGEGTVIMAQWVARDGGFGWALLDEPDTGSKP